MQAVYFILHNALRCPALCDILYSAVSVLVYFLVSNGTLQCIIGGLYLWQNDGDAGEVGLICSRCPFKVSFNVLYFNSTLYQTFCNLMSYNYGYYTQDALFKKYKHIFFLFVPFQVLCGLLGYLPLV